MRCVSAGVAELASMWHRVAHSPRCGGRRVYGCNAALGTQRPRPNKQTHTTSTAALHSNSFVQGGCAECHRLADTTTRENLTRVSWQHWHDFGRTNVSVRCRCTILRVQGSGFACFERARPKEHQQFFLGEVVLFLLWRALENS